MLLKIREILDKNTCNRVFFKKITDRRPVTLFKKTPTQVLSCEIFEKFMNANSEERLWTTAPKRLRKISPLLVLRKPILLLDGKRHNWATNIFHWKYDHVWASWNLSVQYSRYNKMPFVISFRSHKGTKVIMITFKYLEPPIVMDQF